MKAIICLKYGSPSDLKIEDVPKPSPQAHEVLVKVYATSVNDYDWSMVRGKPYPYRLFFGFSKPKNPIPGMELSGIVESVGSEVTLFRIGDSVYGDISDFGFGSFAEYICINEKALIHKPDIMPHEEAAALSHASMLAWQGLVDVGEIKEGMNILINGAGGGVGTMGLQIAKTYNASVTGVDTGEKLKNMSAIGFDKVIDYKVEDFTENGDKYDLILDAKTTRAPHAYLRSLTPEGKYVTVGGTILRLLQILFARKLRRKNVFMVGLKANKDIDQIHRLYEAGKIKPTIDGSYKLEQTAEAIQRFGDGKHTGKVIIKLVD